MLNFKTVLLFFVTISFSKTDAQCWRQVQAGTYHVTGIKQDGTLWAWGSFNTDGQLGIGTNTPVSTPTQIGSDNNWESVSTQNQFVLGLKTDGTLWAWGSNSNGQLGIGTQVGVNQPVQVGSDSDWAFITTGSVHSLAIKNNGTLWAWGSNQNGMLGDGTTTNRLLPVQVGTDTDWAEVGAGFTSTLALKTNGEIWSWGNNFFGSLGNGTTTHNGTPTLMGTDSDWTAISVGYGHTLALKSNGTLWRWGRNDSGQLGTGGLSQQNSPIQVPGTDWSGIHAGFSSSWAWKTDGQSWATGFIGYYFTGIDDDRIRQWQPAGALGEVAYFEVGQNHFAVLSASGGLSQWANSSGVPQAVNCPQLSVSGFDQESIKVYPNPSNGQFILKTERVLDFVITDMNSRLIHQGRASGTEQIDLQHLENGIYLLRTTHGNSGKTFKLLKQ